MSFKYTGNNNHNKRKSTPRAALDITIEDIDYKNLNILRRVISNYAKVLPAKRLGTSSKMQRKLAKSVKQARYMALLPYVRR